MSDTSPAPGAQASVVENPHTDPVTVAWSAYDAAVDRAAGSDDEIARMTAKVDRAKADLEGAKQSLADAREAKRSRAAEVEAAKQAVDVEAERDPDLGRVVRDRRAAARDARRIALKNELAQLKGDN